MANRLRAMYGRARFPPPNALPNAPAVGEGVKEGGLRQPPVLIIRRIRAVHCDAVLLWRLRKWVEL